MKSKRRFTAEFKTKVVLAALKGEKTLAEIAEQYEIHPNQIGEWKRQFLEKAPMVFTEKTPDQKNEEEKKRLYEEIGRLQIEKEYLKKKLEKAMI